jgi:Predicted nucleotide kinase
MHLFLTGDRQIGKSTAIKKALEHTALHAGGFCTYWLQERETLALKSYSKGNGQVVARRANGHMQADAAAFNKTGVTLLADAKCDVIVMDECGFLEEDARLFRQAVLSKLDGDIPVLGVVRQRAGGWTEQIICHPKVHLLHVTKENRDSVPDMILTWLEEETHGDDD